MVKDKAIQRRINPKPWVERSDFPRFGRVIGVPFLVIGIVFAIASVSITSQSLGGGMFLLFGCASILAGTYLVGGGVPPWEWVPVIVHSGAWRRSQTTAQATILGYERKSHRDYEGDEYYTHWVVFRFDTEQGETTLRARVRKPYKRGTMLTVRYAAENPRVALLEDETAENPRVALPESEFEDWVGFDQLAAIVALDEVPLDKTGPESRELILEEFTAALKERGFETSPRSERLHYKPDIPGVRFAIRKRVIRLETDWNGPWKLVRSFSIATETHLALKAADILLEP